VSTSAVDTWRDVKIRTENITEVPNEFLPLIKVPPMIQNKTEVLNLKSRKTQVPIGYLTHFFIVYFRRQVAYFSFSFFFFFFLFPLPFLFPLFSPAYFSRLCVSLSLKVYSFPHLLSISQGLLSLALWSLFSVFIQDS
jgi:hypothetical protein